jgi:large repetitive protein
MVIDERTGEIVWQPTAEDFGLHEVRVGVEDGRGGVAEQAFTLTVVAQGSNRPPSLTSVPPSVATADARYRYEALGEDPDGDPLFWSLDEAPDGMVIDPQTGVVQWTPGDGQIGEHSVSVRVMDVNGSFVGQSFTVAVRGVNVPPAITSTPPTSVGIGQAYTYPVRAADPEGDPLRFELVRHPEGMDIDALTGEINWTPQTPGRYDVEVLVRDPLGGVNRQTYTLEVASSAINRAPEITSTPVYFADSAAPYRYDVEAVDPDGTAPQFQLISAPAGMAIDPITGEVTWQTPILGSHSIVVGASDGTLGAAQGFTLTVLENRDPVLGSTAPAATAQPGVLYRYDVTATDPEGQALTYKLDEASLARGMTLDAEGRLRWMPTDEDAGTHTVTVEVTDAMGGILTQEFDITVAADTVAPLLDLRPASNVYVLDNGQFQAHLNTPVSFRVAASDSTSVPKLQVFANDIPLAVNSNGIATFSATQPGTLTLRAIATDEAGNATEEAISLQVLDPNDAEAPLVELNPQIGSGTITSITDILGTVDDREDNLAFYTLEVAPLAGGEFVEIARGTSERVDGILGEFDPTVLSNDSYRLRLTAVDLGGNASSVEETVHVAGDLKLGNFQLSFTDLSIPVAGIPISVTRTYDSLNAGSTDDFGYGWRLEFRDTDLRTSLGAATPEEQLLEVQPGFEDGTRVYVTVPGGRRVGFTFKPQRDLISQYLQRPGFTSDMSVYHPAFEADDGVFESLRVKNPEVSLNRRDGKFVQLGTGRAYNPADAVFGGTYLLTTKAGIEYEIEGTTGDLMAATDTNGNRLTFTDDGVFSQQTGVAVTFERDATGRIVAAIDPDGQRVRYAYDGDGDLVSVTDREGNTTELKYEVEDRPHYLNEIVDPLGRSGVRTVYDELGRLSQVLDVNGSAVELVYDPDNSVQTVLDVFGKATTYVYDERGNVLAEVDALGGQITRTYDEDNNLLSVTDADGITTEYTYDENGNVLTVKDEDGNTTRMTYGKYGKLLSVASPTGITTSAEYDERGNLISSTDADGLTTTYEYDALGRPIRQESPDGRVMSWGYDAAGNPNRMVDSRGNEVSATYDASGRMQSATSQITVNGQTQTLSTSFTYDSEGRTTSSTNSLGNTQSQTYNALGQVVSTTDSLGNVTAFKYNANGLPTEITLPDNTPNNPDDNPKVLKTYDAANRLISETSPTGLTTRYEYDALGRLVKTLLPDTTPNNASDNPQATTEYTPGSRVQATVDILGNRETFAYDPLGRLKEHKDVFGNPTTYTYNIGGQITSVTDAKNRTDRVIYDAFGRPIETIYFDGTKTKTAYDELGRVQSETNALNQTTRYEYNAQSRVSAIINALGERTEFTYDTRGNLTQIKDANGNVTRYEYDNYGRQIATVAPSGERSGLEYDNFNQVVRAIDPKGNATKYSYDNLQQLTSVELANGAKTNYTYDNLGRLTQVQDANQNATTYEYDAFNRQIATQLPLGQRSSATYNNLGFLSSQTDYNGEMINYAYDAFGRLANKSFTNPTLASVRYTYDPITSQLSTVTDGRGTTRYNYDNWDRMASIVQPDNQSIQYGYDALSNLASVTTAAGKIDYTYDGVNRLDKVLSGTTTLADYDYDKVGNLIKTTRADGTVETRQYDSRDLLKSIETRNSVGTVLSGYTYTLDANGNRQKVVEASGRMVDYTYDSLNRLTSETIATSGSANRTIGYSYDAVGNRLSRTDSIAGVTGYTYDANNRLTATTGNQLTQFAYDNNGSMLSRTEGTLTTNYTWVNDGENRLMGVSNGVSQQQYVYDAGGNRVASIVDGVRTNYLVSPLGLSQVLAEYDGNGQIAKDYAYGLDLVRSRQNNTESFYHADGLGSTRMLTDKTGLVTDRYSYDAF